jgi:hypothetical protein
MRIKEIENLIRPRMFLPILMTLLTLGCEKTDFHKCSDRVREELESCNIQGNDDCATKALRGQKYCGEEYGE